MVNPAGTVKAVDGARYNGGGVHLVAPTAEVAFCIPTGGVTEDCSRTALTVTRFPTNGGTADGDCVVLAWVGNDPLDCQGEIGTMDSPARLRADSHRPRRFDRGRRRSGSGSVASG